MSHCPNTGSLPCDTVTRRESSDSRRKAVSGRTRQAEAGRVGRAGGKTTDAGRPERDDPASVDGGEGRYCVVTSEQGTCWPHTSTKPEPPGAQLRATSEARLTEYVKNTIAMTIPTTSSTELMMIAASAKPFF